MSGVSKTGKLLGYVNYRVSVWRGQGGAAGRNDEESAELSAEALLPLPPRRCE